MTKDELKEYTDAEFRNIRDVLREITAIIKPEKDDYSIRETAVIATFIMNAYTGMEKVIERTLEFDSLSVKDSPRRHNAILEKALELGIIPPELYNVLMNYLSFRQFFCENYSFELRWEVLKKLAGRLDETVSSLEKEIGEYIQTI
jgi:hypothetical protein